MFEMQPSLHASMYRFLLQDAALHQGAVSIKSELTVADNVCQAPADVP